MPLESHSKSESAPEEAISAEKRILEVRSRISDLGFELDAEKAGLGLAMGGGVFLILLAALAGYDLMTGKAGIWLSIGITQDTLKLAVYVCGGVGVVLIAQAIIRRLRRDRRREAELENLEHEYLRLLDNTDTPPDTTEGN